MANLNTLGKYFSCESYSSKASIGFKHYVFEEGITFDTLSGLYYHFIFFLKGKAQINCNEFRNRIFHAQQCIMIPKSANLSYKSLEPSEILVFSFEDLIYPCDKFTVSSLKSFSERIHYDFQPTEIRYPLNIFIDTMVYYIDTKVDCMRMHDIKNQELFLILRGYYQKEELVNLYYPMIGKALDFKGIIMKNYTKIKGVNELANIVHMGRSTFDLKFKEEFGMPPHQWLLKQKARHITYFLTQPEKTIGDVIREFDFNSSTHFNRFCKQQYGCTPSELIRKLRYGDEENSILHKSIPETFH